LIGGLPSGSKGFLIAKFASGGPFFFKPPSDLRLPLRLGIGQTQLSLNRFCS
jgi:hypothetical protein